MSWNARRFDPTAKSLRRHLRHKSKVSARVLDWEDPITEGEIQFILTQANECRLPRLALCARVALRAFELESKFKRIKNHFRMLEDEIAQTQPKIRKLQTRVAYLENQIQRLRRRKKHL